MLMKMYSVFDAKTATFCQPFYSVSDAAAIRSFSDSVNDGSNPNNQWHKHPEDFSLFLIGEFLDDSASLRPVHPPVSLVTASAIYEHQVPAGNNGSREMEAVH